MVPACANMYSCFEFINRKVSNQGFSFMMKILINIYDSCTTQFNSKDLVRWRKENIKKTLEEQLDIDAAPQYLKKFAGFEWCRTAQATTRNWFYLNVVGLNKC